MSEENKTVELKDNDLEKVNGGVGFIVTEVDVGDVFKLNSKTIVIKTHVVDNGCNQGIPVIYVEQDRNGWAKKGDQTIYFNEIKNFWTYSFELSQTLDYLLK